MQNPVVRAGARGKFETEAGERRRRALPALVDSEMGEFLEEFLGALPPQLERTLGRRASDLRPRRAHGTSQLVACMLAKHIDDFAERDIAASLSRRLKLWLRRRPDSSNRTPG